ncbi:MAG: molybdopterin-dependent oxidoreductase [Synergistaceae bacterium]|jgi:anaerobic dimethyl sulfoxide reductase subunit A|nr:molybdopterin-dependent oxidoreductase [Synergistaceae bacterium]
MFPAKVKWASGNLNLSAAASIFAFFAENFLTPLAEEKEEYNALFSGTRFPSLDLWESCYRGEDKRLLNGVTLDVAAAYRDAGLHVDEKLRQPPDHIGVECSFFSYLCGKGGEMESLGRAFFDRHLCSFAIDFAESLEEKTRFPFYKNLARLLRESVEALVKNELGAETLPGVKNSREPEKAPKGLRFLTENELRQGIANNQVPICGINNCGGKCPLVADVSDGCILAIHPSRHPDATKAPGIHICLRGASYHQTFLSGGRLRYPLKRVGERGRAEFERITWDDATNVIAEEIRRIGKQYGPQSRYVNYATGVAGAARGDLFARNLLALDGGFLGKYNSYSTACTTFSTPFTYGTSETGNSSEDLLNSRLIVLWGHNPFESVFGSSLNFYLKEAKKKGTPIVVVDPRFSDTAAELADRWIGLRPTTDGALMDAMAYVIMEERLQDQDFMDRFCLGFDAAHMPVGMEHCENYRDYVFGKYDGTPKTPEWASKITGTDEETIRWLAKKYATIKPAALIQGYGPQRNGNGEQTARSGTLLACLTGNVGIPGGWACGSGYVALHKQPVVTEIPNPYRGKIPAFLWTDAILRGSEMTEAHDGVMGVEKLDANIKMIFNLAGDTLINQHSDVNRSVKILRDTTLCEFIVCSDLFLTPSAKFADILLPGTSLFEGENIGRPWLEGDYVLYCNKSVDPLFECRFEYEWLSEVARKLGHYSAFTHGGKDLHGLLKESYNNILVNEPDMPDFEAFRKNGIYRYQKKRHCIAFEENVRDPANHPFPTPSGKIEIFSPRLYAKNNPSEIPPIPKYVPSFEGPGDPRIEKYPFQLMGWHTKRRTHSTHDNNRRMDRYDLHRVWVNPKDAESVHVSEGDWVNVSNDRGCIRIRVHVTDRIVRGVLAISQGGWYSPDEDGVDLRGCINTVSTARPTPLAKGNPQHSNLVALSLYSKSS